MNALAQLRDGCARVAGRARHVRIAHDAIPAYAAGLKPPPPGRAESDPHLETGTPEQLAAFWLTLDAINFGSGWFPTLRKHAGRSGYFTIAAGVRERFTAVGPWSAAELQSIDASRVARTLGQDPEHELMGLFARSLNDLGRRVADDFRGRFGAVVDAAGGSAVALTELLASWDCFADCSDYGEIRLPFLKRAQIAAADLAAAGVLRAADLDRLTMFADNLVPHVLRIDGILEFEPRLIERIERGELIAHGSPEEVEIRACAVEAVELIVSARRQAGSDCSAAAIDKLLWNRGRAPRYKARPRHRSRCTAY